MAYEYQPINPLQSFTQGFQFIEGLRGVQQQRQQQQLEQQQRDQEQLTKRAFAEDVQAWQMNPSREGWAQLQFKYPQLAERAKPLAEAYGEKGKSAILGVGTQFLSAPKEMRGQILDDAIVAAENSRLPEVAALLKNARALQNTNPEGAEAAVRAAIIQEDGDLYDDLFKRSEKVQNYLDFVEIVGKDAALEIAGVAPKDGIQVLPNGMVIAGRDSPLAKQLAGGVAAELPTVSTKEQLDALPAGAKFIGPDGVERVKTGGTSGNAGGSFR